jgi:hypothetical protein
LRSPRLGKSSRESTIDGGSSRITTPRTRVGILPWLAVAGNISLTQATTFWNRTRKGAMHRIMRFEQAESRYRSTAPACRTNSLPQAAGTTIPVGASDCMRAAVAGERVLAAAQTAITTWQHHVHDMEMLRLGQLSAAQALQMWQMNWHLGQRELAEYRHAGTHARYLRCG